MSSLLIASTVVCLSGYFTPLLINHLIPVIYSKNKVDQTLLRAEIRKLEKEMSGISVVTEFARFTRLQRRHTKLVDELKKNTLNRLATLGKTQLCLTYCNKLITVIVSLMLMYMYGREPVVVLPQKLIWPFEDLLSWPATHNNAISLTVWMIITRIVIETCKNDYS